MFSFLKGYLKPKITPYPTQRKNRFVTLYYRMAINILIYIFYLNSLIMPEYPFPASEKPAALSSNFPEVSIE